MTAMPTLAEPAVVAEWWKNRGGETIRVSLSTYEGRNIVDVRTWFTGTDGVMKPGKGFACSVKHLPKLIAALGKAHDRVGIGTIKDQEL
jgi:hypothetical protein